MSLNGGYPGRDPVMIGSCDLGEAMYIFIIHLNDGMEEFRPRRGSPIVVGGVDDGRIPIPIQGALSYRYERSGRLLIDGYAYRLTVIIWRP